MAVASSATGRPEEAAASTTLWETIEAASGVIFGVFLVVTLVLQGSVPTPDSTSQKIADYFSDNRDAILWSQFIGGIGFIFFFWFVSLLRGIALRSPGGARLGNLAFGAAVSGMAVLLVSAAAYSSISFWIAAEESPNLDAVRALFDIGTITLFASLIPLAVFLLATGIALTRGSDLPAWTGWCAIVLAILAVLGSSGMVDPDNPLGYLAWITSGLFVIWAIVVSVMLLMRARSGALRIAELN